MVHTLPDYTTKYKMTKIFGNIDDAELAARLGSINTFDRRGNIAYFDNCSESLEKWNLSLTGAGASIILTTEKPHMGDASIKLTGGSTVTKRAAILKYTPELPSTRIGAEFIFNLEQDIEEIEIMIAQAEATTTSRGKIQFDIPNNKIYYLAGVAETKTELADYEFDTATGLYHSAKLVIDYSTGKYVRLVLSHRQYDMSTYDLYVNVAAYTPKCTSRFRLTSTDGNNGFAYVGGFIFTQNEP